MNAESPFLSLLHRCARTTFDAVLASILAVLILHAASPGTLDVPMPNGPGAADAPVVIEWFGYA